MKKLVVAHCFLFAVFPILFFFSFNVKKIVLGWSEFLFPLFIVIIFTFLVFRSFLFFIRDKVKASLVTSVFLLLLFSYGHFLNDIKNLVLYGITIERHVYLLILFGILFLSFTFLIKNTSRKLNSSVFILNSVATFLVAIQIINIVFGYFSSAKKGDVFITQDLVRLDSKKHPKHPDIYYIIIDGYARMDTVKGLYHYDNSGFLSRLVKKGFYIADKSYANYCQTALSLASSLNFRHLDGLANSIGMRSDDRRPAIETIRNNRAFYFLKKQGYLCIDLGFGKIKNADIATNFFDPFYRIFLDQIVNITPMPILLWVSGKPLLQDQARKRILDIFDYVNRLSNKDSPLFVFIYIQAPHPPFLFNESGQKNASYIELIYGEGSHFEFGRQRYIQDYRKQFIFITKKIETMVDNILSNTNKESIIILQSDHGPASTLNWENFTNIDFKERMGILNAYYLPDKDYKQLSKSISPVNTFRVIFNHYFGTEHKLLSDRSYFSTWDHPYKFIDITERMN